MELLCLSAAWGGQQGKGEGEDGQAYRPFVLELGLEGVSRLGNVLEDLCVLDVPGIHALRELGDVALKRLARVDDRLLDEGCFPGEARLLELGLRADQRADLPEEILALHGSLLALLLNNLLYPGRHCPVRLDNDAARLLELLPEFIGLGLLGGHVSEYLLEEGLEVCSKRAV